MRGVKYLDNAHGNKTAGVTHRYDLENRDTALAIPHQLGFGADTTITRAYDPQLGTLQSVHDLQQNMYGFYYDLRGELDSLAYPGS